MQELIPSPRIPPAASFLSTCRQILCSSQTTERIGRDAKNVFERARKMERIAEPEILGNLFDQGPRLLQALGGKVHLEAHQKLVGALVIVALEQPAEIRTVQVTFLRDLAQGFQPLIVLLDVLPGLLISRE